MNYKEYWKQSTKEVAERNELVLGRIRQIKKDILVPEQFQEYFVQAAQRIEDVESIFLLWESGELRNLSLDELQELNLRMYHELYVENYEHSYANPGFSVGKFGQEVGQILCLLYSKLVEITPYAYEGKKEFITIAEELFMQIYNSFMENELDIEELKRILYSAEYDYSTEYTYANLMEMLDPEYDFAKEIIMNVDLTDLRYLYWFGKHVSKNELETAEFINQLSQEEIQAMADTFTEGYRIGFKTTGKDISIKSSTQIVYTLGFERMIRAAIENFEKIKLKVTLPSKRISTTRANRQYDFDHKTDLAFYLDKAFVERRLESLKVNYESLKLLAKGYAGPAVIETFGEKDFEPVIKKEAIDYTSKQRQLNVYFMGQSRQLQGKYIIEEERSFTIIAYPIPEIGPRFNEIFKETVKLNTLDYVLYQTIQQRIIDALDTAEYVHILGKNENKTDLKVAMQTLYLPNEQSNFENCVADVNIPVGEVFTSPKLTGTNGKLHVTKVFLGGLQYLNLEMDFKDGMIDHFNCTNFATKEENHKYLSENVLFHHDTLPIGEFAIGTNTTAYRMGIQYDIQAKLPILIAEKTGPHFAIGDTCYSHVENVKVYNPDGKEIIARSNEVVEKNKEDESKAYFNCHTDITIPYNELRLITAVKADGSQIDIIKDGKFVLPGTEELNIPLENL